MITQPTLDLLDSELRRDYAAQAAQEPKWHYKHYRQQIVISPTYWETHYPTIAAVTFDWVHVSFDALGAHLNSLSDDRTGVYLFYIRPEHLVEGMPQHVFYVGIAGEHDSGRPLRTRLGDYLNINNLRKRENVHTQLQLYYPRVQVAYSFLDLASADLAALEKALHGFFYPWAGRRDFPAEVKAGIKAFGGP